MIAAVRGLDGMDDTLLGRLSAWDATLQVEMVEPLIFTAWLRQALVAVYRDDLGAAFPEFFDAKSASALANLLDGRSSRDWCDDVTTAPRESCASRLALAFRAALVDLEQRYGPDSSRWTWGRAHYAFSGHRPLGQLSWVGDFFNVRVPSPGGPDTLNRGQARFGEEPPYVNRHAATFRAIYDFASLDGSLYIHATGQSGNPFSPFYRNFAERWAKGEYIKIPVDRGEIDKRAIGTWRLRAQ
jgi:penicillin amidase